MPDLKSIAVTCREGIYCSPRRLSSYFINGLIIIIPLAVTIWVVIWLFNTVDGFLAPVLNWALGRHIPGASFVTIVLLVLLIGYFGVKIGNRKTFGFFEARFMKIPFLGAIYGSARQIMNSFTATGENILEVVFLEWPRKGIFTPGFVTGVTKCKDGTILHNVFVPTAPTPMGGFLQVVPESEIIHSNMSIGDAMKLIVSIGSISREDIGEALAPSLPECKTDKVNDGKVTN